MPDISKLSDTELAKHSIEISDRGDILDALYEYRHRLSTLDRIVTTTDKGIVTFRPEYRWKCSTCGRSGSTATDNLSLFQLENHKCSGPFIFVKIAKNGPWHLQTDSGILGIACKRYAYKTAFESKEVPRSEAREFLAKQDYVCNKCAGSWRMNRA